MAVHLLTFEVNLIGLTHSFLKSPDKGDLGGVFAGVFPKNMENIAFLRPNVQYLLSLRESCLTK